MSGPPPEVFGQIIDDLPYPVWHGDARGRRQYFNANWREVTGRPRRSDSGWGWLRHVHPSDRGVWELVWADAARSQKPYMTRYRIRTADGAWRWLSERARPLNGDGWFGACRLDEAIGREAELRRLRRIYEAISETNQAIVKLRDRRRLLNRLCEIAVDLGGFDTAWVAWRDAEGRITPIANAGGLNEDLIHLTEVTEAPQAAESDPLVRMFAIDRHHMIRVPDDLSSGSPWHPVCLASGIRAIGAFPLREYGRLVGAFVLHARDPDIFDEPTTALLDEMAGDISFSLDIFMADQERRETERDLRRTRDRLAGVVSSAPLPIISVDRARRVEIWNPAAEQLFCWRRDQVIGQPLPLVSANGDGLGESLQNLLSGRAVRDVEDRVRCRDGRIVPVRIAGAPISNGGGRPSGLMAVIEDMSGEQEARARERLTSAVFEHCPDGIAVTDSEFRVSEANPALARIIGAAEPDELLGEPLPLLSDQTHDAAFYTELQAELERTGHWQGELTGRHRSGRLFPAWLSMSRLPDPVGSSARYVALASDISALKAAEQKAALLALHDPLTGLPNRSLLEERFAAAMERLKGNDTQGAVLFVDLDRFKLINDSLGHNVGDGLLCAVVDRLRSDMPARATFSRLGGDEFIVLLPEMESREEAEAVACYIRRQFETPFTVDRHSLRINATIGIAAFPECGRTLDTVLKKADAAMYAAKAQGRNRCQWFTARMDARAIERNRLESALRDARGNNQLWVALQPQFRLADGRPLATEALMRWNHPRYGLIDPTRFVPLAEDNGDIVPLGEWVLTEACRIHRRLREAGADPGRIAVNVSASQLHHPAVSEMVARAVAEAGIPSDALELEITETMLIGEDEQLVTTLKGLRAQGIRLAIDDFGTGYSSMSHLKYFPIDKLKIDRSFVQRVERDRDNAAIVRAVLGMADSLGLEVVAEGIETAEEAAFLADIGCDQVQGFFYARPMAEDELLAFLHRRHSPPH